MPGPFQLQAAIVACHAKAPDLASTDWDQIVLLYDMLLHLAPSPVTCMHRAIALRHTAGARAALAELDALTGLLEDHHLFHAARADILHSLGHDWAARESDLRALTRPRPDAEFGRVKATREVREGAVHCWVRLRRRACSAGLRVWCRHCGEFRLLTEEHIPPRATGNEGEGRLYVEKHGALEKCCAASRTATRFAVCAMPATTRARPAAS